MGDINVQIIKVMHHLSTINDEIIEMGNPLKVKFGAVIDDEKVIQQLRKQDNLLKLRYHYSKLLETLVLLDVE